MLTIVRREISGFFASTMGYLVAGMFLLISGLFLWVFQGPYNILDAGFSELTAFFDLAPLVFLILIPGICMRSLSEEMRMGTLELLFTRPLSIRSVVLGKVIAALCLILISLLPTLVYVYTIHSLGNPPGNWDPGSTAGSYLGLFLLSGAYSTIGVFCSSLSGNQITAFLLAVMLCFVGYYGIDALADMLGSETVAVFGMKYHFDSLARGVVDLRDIGYFATVMILFLGATVERLERLRR
jgi:ABC-2 type transport system permease protein